MIQGWTSHRAGVSGETLIDGLKRECFEEIGADVEVLELMHVADYHRPRMTDPPSKRQQVEFLFRCELPSGYKAQNGPKPDKHQIDILWLHFDEINKNMFYPKAFRDILLSSSTSNPVYLGLID
ncbi:MAG: NUDIX domain-containing protein [Rhodospirillales bacterium]|nr:NUDIX domain-containing protein [Rhodospirillales bacterium]